MTPVVKNLPANAGDTKDVGSISKLGRCPGGGCDNPFQYSWLENPKDRGAWWAIIHRVAKSQTWLKWLSMHRTRGQRIAGEAFPRVPGTFSRQSHREGAGGINNPLEPKNKGAHWWHPCSQPPRGTKQGAWRVDLESGGQMGKRTQHNCDYNYFLPHFSSAWCQNTLYLAPCLGPGFSITIYWMNEQIPVHDCIS